MKSVCSFIVGLIFSIIGAISSFVFGITFIFISIAVQPNSFIMIIPFINIATYVFALIGAIFSLFNTKISGIIMLVASTLSIFLFIVLCIGIKMFDILFVLFWLPTIFILIAGIIAMIKNKKQIKKP